MNPEENATNAPPKPHHEPLSAPPRQTAPGKIDHQPVEMARHYFLGAGEQHAHAQVPASSVSPWRNPTQLERPAFLLNFPFSYCTDYANNLWMEEMSKEERKPDHKRAAIQFLEVYRILASEGLVYILPSPDGINLQDLVYTANLGVVLTHLPNPNTVIISNFSSPPRRAETPLGVRFFHEMGYEVYQPSFHFEGEAELKHLHDNIYVGGYGIRSQRETYDWMEQMFDMRIIRIKEVEPYLYHLDCTLFPITRENTLVCTELLTREEIRELEQVTNVIPVTADDAYSGICNCVRLPNQVLNASNIHEMRAGTEDYRLELQKNQRLEYIISNLALEVCYLNISEFLKSGALLSCMVMHLNRHSYQFTLTA